MTVETRPQDFQQKRFSTKMKWNKARRVCEDYSSLFFKRFVMVWLVGVDLLRKELRQDV